MSNVQQHDHAHDYDKQIKLPMGKWPLLARLEMAWRAFRQPEAYRAAPVIGCAILDRAIQAEVVVTRRDGSALKLNYALLADYVDCVQVYDAAGGTERKDESSGHTA